MGERSASSSSYFARPPPPCRLLLRVYAARGLRNVTNHGTYCKVYVTSADMVHGSSSFKRRQAASTSAHSFGGLLPSPFSSSRRSNLTQSVASTSSSEGDLSDTNGKMRVLKTQIQKGKRHNPVWNEKFDIPVLDMNEEVLTIRVKSATLMSPAIGACAISLKHLAGLSTTTIDRWVDLKQGKKDAGRIRLQLRLVDSSTSKLQESDPTSTRTNQDDNNDSLLSLPAKETLEEIAARMKKSSRLGHKYHRSARHFDGRPVTNSVLGSSCSSYRSASDKDEVPQQTIRKPRDNSASATSNESIDDSESASDVSISPVSSPRSNRTSTRDISFASSALDRSTAKERSSSRPVKAAAMGLDASFAQRGTMRRSELEKTRRCRLTSSSTQQGPQDDDFDSEEDLDEFENQKNSITRWTSNHSKYSEISSIADSKYSEILSIADSRESSRMDFDADYDEWDSRTTGKKSQMNASASIVLSSTGSSTLDLRESSQFSLNDDSDSDSEEEDEAKLEKAREQQRQQWQMQQRKMQLARIQESSHSTSDEEIDEEEDDSESEDQVKEVLEPEMSRVQFTPTIATLLSRESMNVLMEEEDEDEGAGSYKRSMDFIPILEATSPTSVDLVDCALRRSSFD